MEILELKSVITKMKYSVDGFLRRMEGTEKRISESKDVSVEMIQSKKKRQNRKKKKKA